MKTTARLAAVTATLLFVSGCTGGLRDKDRPLREPVRSASAPAPEPNPTAPAAPNITGSTPLPPSTTASPRWAGQKNDLGLD
jgi:hypothetical protein